MNVLIHYRYLDEYPKTLLLSLEHPVEWTEQIQIKGISQFLHGWWSNRNSPAPLTHPDILKFVRLVVGAPGTEGAPVAWLPRLQWRQTAPQHLLDVAFGARRWCVAFVPEAFGLGVRVPAHFPVAFPQQGAMGRQGERGQGRGAGVTSTDLTGPCTETARWAVLKGCSVLADEPVVELNKFIIQLLVWPRWSTRLQGGVERKMAPETPGVCGRSWVFWRRLRLEGEMRVLGAKPPQRHVCSRREGFRHWSAPLWLSGDALHWASSRTSQRGTWWSAENHRHFAPQGTPSYWRLEVIWSVCDIHTVSISLQRVGQRESLRPASQLRGSCWSWRTEIKSGGWLWLRHIKSLVQRDHSWVRGLRNIGEIYNEDGLRLRSSHPLWRMFYRWPSPLTGRCLQRWLSKVTDFQRAIQALPLGRLFVMDMPRRSRGVVETAPTRLLPPSAVPPQHQVGSFRCVLPTPGLLHPVNHAGVEICQLTTAAPESHVQLIIHVFRLEPQQWGVSAAFIHRAQGELTGVTFGDGSCRREKRLTW